MDSIQETMTDDHRRCDDLFAESEEFVANDSWGAGAARFEEFAAALERHFKMEEEVLFPRFEESTGMTGGPTEVMRSEHAQMRLLLEDLAEAVGNRDSEGYLGQAETLLIIMQQHNVKEEQMLYPMADESLGVGRDEVLSSMNAV